jgi:hypothetical protein
MRASRKFPPRPWLLVAGLAGALHAQQAPRTEVVTAALAAGHAATQARIAAAPQLELADGGLCGLLGGATVKLGSGAATVLQVPLPQELAGQVPLAFTCVVEPADVWRGAALVREPGQSVALQVTLQAPRSLGMLFGRGPEVKVAWSGVVLLAERPEPVVADAVADYLAATPCAPAEHADLVASSKAIAPPETSPAELAVRLQTWIASRRPLVRPRTLDALSLLSAGNHGICTVNANFAAAVLRQRGVPAQLLAVVPTNGMRLEMHRIVAWHEAGRWQRFDPSGVHADVPMRTSHSVVVACTSIADERGAGQPRGAAPIGCPWGQELEVVRGAAAPSGPEFFWTQARPLLAFAADDRQLAAARAAWRQFLATGRLPEAATRAAAATTPAQFAAAWGAPPEQDRQRP